MKKYSEYTTAEKLALTQEEFAKAVKIEGIHRGIKPPITLGDALRKSEFNGFSLPADVAVFYEIVIPQGAYSGMKETGLCFNTAEAARAAMAGAFSISESGYGATAKKKITTGDFSVKEAYITVEPQKWYATNLEEFFQDNEGFDKLSEECSADLSSLRQEAYNAAVLQRKRAEYLALANGDISIATAFWARTESVPFPQE